MAKVAIHPRRPNPGPGPSTALACAFSVFTNIIHNLKRGKNKQNCSIDNTTRWKSQTISNSHRKASISMNKLP